MTTIKTALANTVNETPALYSKRRAPWTTAFSSFITVGARNISEVRRQLDAKTHETTHLLVKFAKRHLLVK